MKVLHTVIGVSGSTHVESVEMVDLSKIQCLKCLGLTKLPYPKVDMFTKNSVKGQEWAVVELATDKPWTYIKHIFAKA